MISQFSPTSDRAKVLDFVNYAQSGTSLGVLQGNPEGLEPDELCGSKVGVQKGSSQAAETLPGMSKDCEADGDEPIQMSTFPESTATVLALKSNRVDAILLDSPVLGYAAKKSSGAIEVAGTIATRPVAIGVPKDSGLVEPIQQALLELEQQGVTKSVFGEWGMDDSVIHDFAINKIVEG
ncbi:MAG: transporter substrate-binding domain-containing protein [Actinomycetia bacterium]|nr:transporter substrate-binding domain-containing protein [Actinomycetes bacterium]